MNARIGLITLALISLLAACSTGPRPPLMSAIDGGGRYGYVDREVAPDRIEVRYTGPNRYGFGRYGRTSSAQNEAINQAYDFALWRAAQIAQSRNVRGFVVVDSRTDLRGRDEPGYYESGPYTGIGVGASRGSIGTGIGLGTGFGGVENDYSTLQATVTLTVDLRNESTERFYIADEVIAQARQTYPNAEIAPPN